jgi:serine kinase of HPr protein (carbohydrate metabolism regulator)
MVSVKELLSLVERGHHLVGCDVLFVYHKGEKE